MNRGGELKGWMCGVGQGGGRLGRVGCVGGRMKVMVGWGLGGEDEVEVRLGSALLSVDSTTQTV